MGQFHIDFELKVNGVSAKNVYAEKSIFLGKKTYIDCLVGEIDGKIVRGNHLRMKGVPNTTIKHTAKLLGKTEYELYKQMYDSDNKIGFDLLEINPDTGESGRCNFKFNKDMSVHSLREFERKLKFTGEKWVNL